MTKDEALKLALEALQKIYIAPEHEEYIRVWWPACEQAIPAIKEALAQSEQEPVVWMYQDKSTHKVWIQKHMRDFVDHGQTYETPLYTSPPQRTWVGLTDEEVNILVDDEDWYNFPHDFAKAIEAKLKEKNI